MQPTNLPKVTVIICTKDRPDEVVHCLDSIRVQSRPPDEIIIVDASQDSALRERLNDWPEAEMGELLYVRSDPGLPHQRNVGIKAASGQIIFFFDDDIVLDGTYIREVIRIFDADAVGRIGGVMGDIHEEREARQNWAWWRYLLRAVFFLPRFGDGRFLPSGGATWPYGIDQVQATEFLGGAQVAYRRQVFEKVLFDDSLQGYAVYEDADFSYRESRFYQNIYTPSARCWHIKSPLSRPERGQLFKMRLENFSYLFHKNMPQSVSHRIAFHIALLGLRVVPQIEYYLWRIRQAIRGELPRTNQKQAPE